ncbi:hypothetical protein LWI28_001766 [Acer negundo]|uniref:Uncharacterized protein n=1 Tax=Acer negundo TaxID=4023 RepID=A0AAD5IBK2_ACENE|nr:hypothetical protein LWI28_001766 [Acer negundo]
MQLLLVRFLSNSGLGQDCEENKCTYRVESGDETSSSGYLSIERLTIRSASGRSTIAVNDICLDVGKTTPMYLILNPV